MKLTKREKDICEEYRKRNELGFVNCFLCPLAIDQLNHICYANVDGRTRIAKKLKRYKEEKNEVGSNRNWSARSSGGLRRIVGTYDSSSKESYGEGADADL